MITITDVAKYCDVSESTVSRVLNGNTRISSRTAEKVFEAVDTLGYVPIRKTRSVKRSQEILLVMPNPSLYTLGTTVKDMTLTLEQSDIDLRIMNLHHERTITRETARRLCRKNSAGIILYGCIVPEEAAEVFYAENVPVVVQQGHTNHLVSICVNNYNGMREASSYVVSRGYKKIGFIGWEKTDFNVLERRESFENVMRRSDLSPKLQSYGRLNIEGGYRAMKEMMEAMRPDAVVFAADVMAYGGIQYLNERQLSYPSDVGLIGFDDAYLSGVVGLTTMYQLLEENVRLVLEHLLDMIEQKTVFEAKEVLLTPRLVVRRSLR